MKVDLDLDLGVVVGGGATPWQLGDEDHCVGEREKAVELHCSSLYPSIAVRTGYARAVRDGCDGVRRDQEGVDGVRESFEGTGSVTAMTEAYPGSWRCRCGG